MTEPLSFTDLSPELIDELAARCEGCEAIAEYACHFVCGNCGPRVALYCERCRTIIRLWADRKHVPCGDGEITGIRWERIS